MATIASLAVNIIAKTDKFIAGLNASNTAVGRFVKKVATAQTALVGLGVYGFGRMISNAVNAGSELHDLSKKIGITTEALGALDYATKQLGGSTSAMHTALQFMSKTLGQAAQGATAAQAAFERLGINFKDLLGLPVEQQFLSLVDAINKLPTASERAAAAQQVFGRGGKELAGIIAAGTAEIVKFGDAAAASGALISSEQAAALDEAADAATAFKDSWSALWTQGVAVFAPLITGAFVVLGATIRALRAIWLSAQIALIGGFELVHSAIQKTAEGMNLLLPKFAEIDVEGFRANVETYAAKRHELLGKLDVIGGKTSGAGPLQVPTAQATGQIKEQKTTNEKLDQLIAVQQAGQGNVQLATAGVR